jgi:hypothetical protein
MASGKYTPDHIWALITDNKADNALKILDGIRDGSVWVNNATAVCWMRLGKPEKASAVLMDMVYKKNSVIMKTSATDTTKLNLTTAMLMTGNIDGALTVLNAVEHNSPMKDNLIKAIAAWKKQQSIGSQLLMLVGMYPNKPVNLDFAPGQIEVNVKEVLEQ